MKIVIRFPNLFVVVVSHFYTQLFFLVSFIIKIYCTIKGKIKQTSILKSYLYYPTTQTDSLILGEYDHTIPGNTNFSFHFVLDFLLPFLPIFPEVDTLTKIQNLSKTEDFQPKISFHCGGGERGSLASSATFCYTPAKKIPRYISAIVSK